MFVAKSGNAFMRDIAGWFVEAARATGRDADIVAAGGGSARIHSTVGAAPHRQTRAAGMTRAPGPRHFPSSQEAPK
ncbi:MAG: hypothetical protein ACO3D0_12820, partial [Ilumatobacteraceae bacterium]